MFHIEVHQKNDNLYKYYLVKAKDYGQAAMKLSKSLGKDVEMKLIGYYEKSEIFTDTLVREQ